MKDQEKKKGKKRKTNPTDRLLAGCSVVLVIKNQEK